MKRILTITIFTGFLLSFATGQSLLNKENRLFNNVHSTSRSVLTTNYTLTTFSEPYNDLTGATSINNGEIWDEPDYIVPLPFPFTLLGTDVTYLEFYGSGSLMRAPTEDPNVDAYVFSFETDLVDRGSFGSVSLSPISYKSTGTVGNHILKIEFKNAGSYYEMDENGTLDMFINFQLWLFEGSNKIEFHFGNSSINDPSVFYGGDIGAGLGVTNYNETDDIISNPHFLVGQPSNPTLSANVSFLNGTPSNGTVYRLSLQSPLHVDVTGQNGTSFCNPNGTATATATEGTEPYTYHWNTGATTSAIINLGDGTYTVTVTDASAMTATGSTTITIPDPIEVNASSTDETAVNANDGTAIAIPTNGLPPFGWLWSNGSAGFEIVNLAPGIYTVTITDDAGCTASQSVTVNAFGCPELTIEADVTNVSCFGLCDGTIDITGVTNGAGNYEYNWSPIGSTLPSAINLCPGDYIVTITDDNGCQVIGSYTIIQPTELHANAGSTNETIQGLNDGTASASPFGGTAPYFYHWNNSGTNQQITNLAPGIYTVTVTDSHDCSSIQTVTVEAGPCGILIHTITNTTCFGMCNGSISVHLNNEIPPATYNWSIGVTSPTITELCAGEYIVTATNGTGCIVIETYSVTEPPEIFTNVGSTDETAQGGNDGTAWVIPFGGTPPYTYLWSNGSVDSLIINLSPDLYSVVVTDANGCSQAEFVDINSFTCFDFIDGKFKDVSCFGTCDGQVTVIPIGGVGPYTYAWSTGDTTKMITICGDSTYNVVVTDMGQGCSDNIGFELQSPAMLTIAIDSVINISPTGTSSISVTITGGVEPYLYVWSGPNGFSDTMEDLFDIPVGYYDLLVTDAHGCTTSVDSIEIKETVGFANPDQLDVRVYPNPARDEMHIDIGEISNYQIQLTSFDGRIVDTWKNVRNINVRDIAVGIYAIKVTSGEKYYIQRLVIGR